MTVLSYEEYVRDKITMIKDQVGAKNVAYDLAGVDLMLDDRTVHISIAAIHAMSMLVRNAEEQAIGKLRAEAEERALRRVAHEVTITAPEQVHG